MVQNLYKLGLIKVLIPQEKKRFQYFPSVYYRCTLYNSPINIRYISFFSCSDTHQFHHLLGCNATGINSSFNSFLSALCFSNLIC